MSSFISIRETIPAHILRCEHKAMPVDCELIYETNDPACVRMDLRLKGTHIVQWAFDRQLLDDGMFREKAAPAGEGDVTSWTDFRKLKQHIVLTSPHGGSAELVLDWACVGVFVQQMHDLVPDRRRDELVHEAAELLCAVLEEELSS